MRARDPLRVRCLFLLLLLLPACLLLGAPLPAAAEEPVRAVPGQPERSEGSRAGVSPVLVRVAGQPAYDPAEWVWVANHLHSAPGGGGWRRGVRHILGYCDERAIDFAFMTDHNTIEHWFWPEFRVTGRTVPVGGIEWTSSKGHANLVGFRAATPDQAILPCGSRGLPDCPGGGEEQDHAGMIAETHGRGGIVIINHPELKGYTWPDETLGADAVEVNGTMWDFDGDKARAWWHRQLVRGARLTGFGGSDYHYFRPLAEEGAAGEGTRKEEPHVGTPMSPEIDTPINLVRVEARTIPAVLEAVRAGHVQVLADLKQPKVFIGVDADGDGDFGDFRAGDRVRAVPGRPLAIQVRVIGGKGQTLHLIEDEVAGGGAEETREASSVEIDSDDFVHAIERRATVTKRRFLRTEIGRKGVNVTNPVYY